MYCTHIIFNTAGFVVILQVRKALCVLLQHKLASFQVYKHIVSYKANVENILRLLYYPKIIYTAKVLYGDMAEIIVEEILHHGIVRVLQNDLPCKPKHCWLVDTSRDVGGECTMLLLQHAKEPGKDSWPFVHYSKEWPSHHCTGGHH